MWIVLHVTPVDTRTLQQNAMHVICRITTNQAILVILVLACLQTVSCAIPPVSYTHLDVYKRQDPGYAGEQD